MRDAKVFHLLFNPLSWRYKWSVWWYGEFGFHSVPLLIKFSYQGCRPCLSAGQKSVPWSWWMCRQAEEESKPCLCQCSCEHHNAVLMDVVKFGEFLRSGAHQTSTLLWRRLLWWKMFGRSQLLDNTFTSSLSMPRLTLILSRLSEFKVAELSMNGAPWKVARSHRHSTGEYGRKSQPVSGSATYQLHGKVLHFFVKLNHTCASSTAM